VGGGDPVGGSAELARLIDRYGECLVADFQSEYGLNLAQLIHQEAGHSPKTVLALVQQLPMGSRTISAIRGGEQFVGWDADRYLLANIFDAIQANTYAIVAANSAKGKKPKPPKPIDRPKRNMRVSSGSNTAANPFAVMAARYMKAAKEAKEG